MSEFTWLPDYNASRATEPRVKAVRFGDGYEQRQADGINTIREQWSLTFSNRDLAEADAIDAFLTAQAGVENFDWIPPRESVAKKFICRAWQRTPVTGVIDTISATFERVYEA